MIAATAKEILFESGKTIEARGPEYDQPAGERSMAHCVRIFNAVTGRDLTEFEGWLFMDALKTARMMANSAKADTYVDKAAYTALAGECALAATRPDEWVELDEHGLPKHQVRSLADADMADRHRR